MLTQRNIKFSLPKSQKKYWFDNSPIKTLHANTLTSSIPYGERFFVQAVLPYLKNIKDKNFKKDVLTFARQELNHSKEHYRLFLKMVKPYYPKLKVKNKFYHYLFGVIAYIIGPKCRLSFVAACEHYTAVAAEIYLSDPSLMEGVEKETRLLWQWHFIEEIEHKAVAFDILQTIGCHYITRVFGFILATIFLSAGFVSTFLHMVIYDKLYRSKRFFFDTYQFFLGKQGLLRKLFKPSLRYLLPKFHPNHYRINTEWPEIETALRKIQTPQQLISDENLF